MTAIISQTFAKRFYATPPELQAQILSHVDSYKHIAALSLASRHMRELTVDLLFQDIGFTAMVPNIVISRYLELIAPKYGRYCRRLNLAFSMCRIDIRFDNTYRATLYANLLKACSDQVRNIVLDAGGFDLADTKTTLEILGSVSFSELESLTVKCFDLENHETQVLSDLFESLAMAPFNMPRLKTFALEGHWRLASKRTAGEDMPDTTSVFVNFKKFLNASKSLRKLNLSQLGIHLCDLKSLLEDMEHLEELSLEELETCSLQDCFAALMDIKAQTTLQVLDLQLSCPLVPSASLKIPSKKIGQNNYVFPALKRLRLSLSDWDQGGSVSDLKTSNLYASMLRCRQLCFPMLEVLDADSAFSGTARSARLLATYSIMAKRTTMPALREVICAHKTPADSIAVTARTLSRHGLRLTRAEPPCAFAEDEDQSWDVESGYESDRDFFNRHNGSRSPS